jgi:hypothetical protein
MGVLPPTGTMISMARAARAYNNVAPGSQSVSFGNVASAKLNSFIGRAPTVTTAFSAVFGGRTTPFTY